MAKSKSTPATPETVRETPSGAPLNPLIDAVPRETLERVEAMLTWLAWHKRDQDARPSAKTAEQLALGDALMRDLVRDAVAYEAKRATEV